jgi:hypothetical protein
MSSMVFIFDVLSTDLEIGYGSSLSLGLCTPEKNLTSIDDSTEGQPI